MYFGKKIRELRERKGMVLRKVAVLLDIDTATLSKIELGYRQAKREYLPIFAKIYNIELHVLEKWWLVDKVYTIIEEEKQALNVLEEARTMYQLKREVVE